MSASRVVGVMRSLIRPEAPGRWVDLVALAVTALFLALLVHDLVPLLPNLDPAKIAVDYNLYVEATKRWLAGGAYYLPYQLNGPYEAVPGVILYPPPFTLVMLPFVVLPWIAYWAVPIGAVIYASWRHRPRVIAWPGIALCLWFPGTTVMLVAGNPTMLIVLGVCVLVSVPFFGMWVDYAKVLLDARHPLGLLYNLGQVPTMLLPIVVWAGRRRSAHSFQEPTP